MATHMARQRSDATRWTATLLLVAVVQAPLLAGSTGARADEAPPPQARPADDPGLGSTAPPARAAPPAARPGATPGATMQLALPAPGPSAPLYRTVVKEKRLYSLMTAGLVIFGSSYFLNALFGGYVSDNPGFYVPVIGPVLFKAGDDRGLQAALVFDTLVQAAGVAMAIVGGVVKTKVEVREPITIVPLAAPGAFGLAAAGRF